MNYYYHSVTYLGIFHGRGTANIPNTFKSGGIQPTEYIYIYCLGILDV